MSDVLRLLIAPAVWLATFSAIYGLHGLGCAQSWDAVALGQLSLFRALLLAAWLTATATQAALLAALRSARFAAASPFIRRGSVITGWVGLLATLWTLQPVATTSACT